MAVIETVRPPLNLFEVVREDFGSTWTTLYEVPTYLVPALGPTPAYFVGAAAITTSLVVVNSSGSSATFNVRVQDPTSADPDPYSPGPYNSYVIVQTLTVPANSFVNVDLNRQVTKSMQIIQVQASTGATLTAHFSFVLNQREQFTIIP